MTHEIEVSVNGEEHQLEVEAKTLLVDALRSELGYTGTKIGCETSLCGACTVHMDGAAVKSCTYLAVQADGRELTTVEGLTDSEELHPLQRSFQEEHGLQCGYCTPGMLMTSLEYLTENGTPERDEIREAIDGNFCRCTGYQNVVNAIETASQTGTFDQSGAIEDDE